MNKQQSDAYNKIWKVKRETTNDDVRKNMREVWVVQDLDTETLVSTQYLSSI